MSKHTRTIAVPPPKPVQLVVDLELHADGSIAVAGATIDPVRSRDALVLVLEREALELTILENSSEHGAFFQGAKWALRRAAEIIAEGGGAL